MENTENKYKIILLEMIVENQKLMFSTSNINDVFYFTNVDTTLKEVYAKMFKCDLSDKRQQKQFEQELDKIRNR